MRYKHINKKLFFTINTFNFKKKCFGTSQILSMDIKLVLDYLLTL